MFLADFQLTDAQWDGLMVPIEMAFFFNSTPHGKSDRALPQSRRPHRIVAVAGHLGRTSTQTNPILNEMEPDVTALLVNRVGHGRGSVRLPNIIWSRSTNVTSWSD